MLKTFLQSIGFFSLMLSLTQCGGATALNTGGVGGDASGGGGGDSGGGTDGGGTGGDSSGSTCPQACPMGRLCCGGQCVNPDNDPHNCGGCGVMCRGNTPYCSGSCQAAPCTLSGGSCTSDGGGGSCCGNSCCASGQICCKAEGPLAGAPSCLTPTATQPTCMQGCAPLCISDRNAKRQIEPVDEQAVLAAVAHMPVSTWSYKSDDPAVRHMGPMAQDFHAAFGLGSTDRAYDPVDAHGITFAAIQALYEQLGEQRGRIEQLERDNEAMRASCR